MARGEARENEKTPARRTGKPLPSAGGYRTTPLGEFTVAVGTASGNASTPTRGNHPVVIVVGETDAFRRQASGSHALRDQVERALLQGSFGVTGVHVTPIDPLGATGEDLLIDWEAAEEPSDLDVRHAITTLLRLDRARSTSEWDHAVEGLTDSPSLDTDRLFQAQQHAALRRWVIDHVRWLSPSEIAELMPERVGADSNTARAVDKLRERGELIAVPYKSGWRYPDGQISQRGHVHDALVPVVTRARDQGYDPWEIVHWLARPLEPATPIHVGRPIEHADEHLSLDDLFLRASERMPAPAAPATLAASPFELLARDDRVGFEQAVEAWLGPER